MTATRSRFFGDLERLKERLIEMAFEADAMLELALRALTEQDVVLAEEVLRRDDIVDALDLEIEAECLRLIALQQPVSSTLRLIGTAFKAITDLERIGDHAVDIAKTARKLAQAPFYKPLVDLPRMGERVRLMLKDAMTAFLNHDLSLVEKVINDDDEVDEYFLVLREDLHAAMRRDSALVVQASYLLFVAHYLERIADHIVNIAERVYYIETGELAQLARSHKVPT